MEALASVGGVVLGILALIGVSPMTLLPIAAIVLGGALLMVGGSAARVESLTRSQVATGTRHIALEHAPYVATGSDLLVGVGAIVLGILGLGGHAPLTLAIISMLGIGAAVLLNGSTIAARLFGLVG